MKLSRVFVALVTGTLLSAALAAVADDSLQTVYAEILRGDYDAGRVSIRQLLDNSKTDTEQVKQVNTWLGDFEQVVSSRADLRNKSFDWNLEQAKKAFDEGKIYLALSFAAQTNAYAENEKEYATSPWIRDKLRPAVMERAASFTDTDGQEQWVKAHAFYVLLQRIEPDDKEIEKLREQAARHARLELIYETHDDVERRIEDVTYDMLARTVQLVEDNYYTDPDFKKMAHGSIDNLIALCNTRKLYEGTDTPSEFDGLADPMAREYFLSQLQQQERKIDDASTFGGKELLQLYHDIKDACRKSISLPNGLLIVEFTEGALDELDDYTSVVWPADAREFDKMMVGNFVGVGIQLGIDELSNRLKVVTPLEDSPSLEQGIEPGDLIIGVDGETTKDWTTEQAVREITGPEGTEVTLTIYRPRTGKRIDFTLERRPIKLTTIRGVKRHESGEAGDWDFMLDKGAGIAYIRLTNFNPDSAEELHASLEHARKQGMCGLVLDLRHNPGGLLDVAVDTVSTFLSSGRVVKTDGRSEQPQRLRVTGDADYADLPLVVLVNEHSASASEILAGCLRDHDRAIVLGERTFGKGSVQRVYPLERRSFFGEGSRARLKLTTALYYLPSGISPHKKPGAETWGVEPDVNVELTPKEFAKVLERQSDAFIIHNENGKGTAEDADAEQRDAELAKLKVDDEDDQDNLLSEDDIQLLRADPTEAPDVDPQLETALLQLRVKLAANIPWPRQLAQKPADD